jgi:uncharacterized membrane protein YjjP (DUF1212 family)
MKAQAALEFLMTYGWAILIVIAVVAALYAMGVFRLPSGGLGKCSPCFPAGSAIAYVDHNANSLVVRVGPSQISSVNATVGATTSANVAGPSDPGTTVTMSGANLFSGDASVSVAYTDTASGLSHTVSATLHGG